MSNTSRFCIALLATFVCNNISADEKSVTEQLHLQALAGLWKVVESIPGHMAFVEFNKNGDATIYQHKKLASSYTGDCYPGSEFTISIPDKGHLQITNRSNNKIHAVKYMVSGNNLTWKIKSDSLDMIRVNKADTILLPCDKSYLKKPIPDSKYFARSIDPNEINKSPDTSWSSDTSAIEGTWRFKARNRINYMLINESGEITTVRIKESIHDRPQKCIGRNKKETIQHDGNGQYRILKKGGKDNGSVLKIAGDQLIISTVKEIKDGFWIETSIILTASTYPNDETPNCLQP